MKKKAKTKTVATGYEEKLRKAKQKKELNEAIKETNNNIKEANKIRRELGSQITFAPMDELIPIKKAINKGEDGFKFRHNFGFFNIVRVVSFDYSAMDDEDLNMHVFYWDRFYRTTAIPIKRLSLNMPVDTTQKILYYRKRLEQTDNPLYQQKIKSEIEELKTKFNKRQTRDYYLFYYAENLDSLMNETAHITASLEERGYVVKLTPLKKLEIMNKLSNPYSNKKMLTDNFT